MAEEQERREEWPPEEDDTDVASTAASREIAREEEYGGDEEYRWHTGAKRDHGSIDAIEFIDVKKSFGRNTILNGLPFASERFELREGRGAPCWTRTRALCGRWDDDRERDGDGNGRTKSWHVHLSSAFYARRFM